MKIEAVTVCVGYHDMFSLVISNKIHFDKWIVVTCNCDRATKNICAKEGIECIISNRSGLPKNFRKGRLINDGLQALNKCDWLLQIDCDILLPNNFRSFIESYELSNDFLYGCKREIVCNKTFKQNSKLFTAFNKENRWIKRGSVLGYFQLFHSSKFIDYPENSNTCAHDDIDFMSHWSKCHRQLLPISITHFGVPFNEEKWMGKSMLAQVGF